MVKTSFVNYTNTQKKNNIISEGYATYLVYCLSCNFSLTAITVRAVITRRDTRANTIITASSMPNIPPVGRSIWSIVLQ